MIRGHRYWGELYLLAVELRASVGENLQVEVVVFVPQLDPGETWNLPQFIGFKGFLDRIRFAVDAEESLFYFGALGSS